MGYVFLGLVFLGAISSVYYWEYKAQVRGAENMTLPKHVESGEQVPEVNGIACEDEVTWATHKTTGEKREFPTPCHVNLQQWDIVKN